jgi:hypothetical protein
MPRAVAERLCAAVYAFARTGAGTIERAHSGDPWLLRLRTGDGVALIRLVPARLTIEVEVIYRGRV